MPTVHPSAKLRRAQIAAWHAWQQTYLTVLAAGGAPPAPPTNIGPKPRVIIKPPTGTS
jgi:hypothetical protein